MKTLFDDIVVLAHNYPYWCGPTAETYLEEEIAALSQHASRIVVVAFEGFWEPGGTLRSGLPDNIVPIQLLEPSLQSEPNNLKRRLDQLRRVFTSEFIADRPQLKSRAHVRTFNRFNELSTKIFTLTLEKLLDLDPEFGSGKTLIYSFWFNEPARAAVLLRNALAKLRDNSPVAVARAHGYDCYAYRNDLDYLPCQEWIANRLDKVFPCSMDGVNYLQNRNPKAANKFEVAYLGVRQMPSGEGINPEEPIVMSCSRVVPLKRLDRVARSLALLRDRGCRFKWICIGDGQDLRQLKELSHSLGLDEVARFTGSLTQPEIRELYFETSASVFVQASEYEGVPLAIMEAMSASIPVVATRVGGVPEIVEDRENGLLLDKDFSDEELAGAIEYFLDEPRPNFRAAASQRWKERFSSSSNALKMLNICDNIWTDINR